MMNSALIKIFLGILLGSLVFVNASAATKAQFGITGEQVLITISGQSPMGQYDHGPEQLYKDLNLPAEKSFIGSGKVLKDSNENMIFIVADRGNQRFDVSIVLKKSKNIEINPLDKYAVAKFIGSEAQYLLSKWQSINSRYEFINQEGNLKIIAEPEVFLLSYTQ